MRWQVVFKILLIALLILLSAPLLGALAMMATGGRLMPQMPGMVHGGKAESSGQKSRTDERTSRPRPRSPEGARTRARRG